MKIIVAVLTSTFLIGGAYAQSPAPSAGVSPAAMKKADTKRDMNVEKHIKDLHSQLKITSAEESQWAAVAKTMRDSATEIDKAIDKREASINSATAVDNLNAYGDIARAHADAVKDLSAAFSPLYASMSDDQKKLADRVFAQHGHDGKNAHKAMK